MTSIIVLITLTILTVVLLGFNLLTQKKFNKKSQETSLYLKHLESDNVR